MPRWINHAITGATGIILFLRGIQQVNQPPQGFNTDIRLIMLAGLILIAIAACTWPRKED